MLCLLSDLRRTLVAAAVVLALIPAGVLAFTLISIPALLYDPAEPEGTPNGVTPDTGSSGTAFVFMIRYTFVGTTPGIGPSRTEVHIDLDGDGVAGGIVTPFAAPPLPTTWPGTALFAMVGIALLALGWRLRHRPRLAHGTLIVAAMLLAFACSGDSSDPPPGTAFANHGPTGLAACTSPQDGDADEIITLTGDGQTDFTLGADYFETVTLNCTAPGLVLFQYVFEIGGASPVPVAFGTSVNLHTLTITP